MISARSNLFAAHTKILAVRVSATSTAYRGNASMIRASG
jgi:hypothetical protein